MPPQVVSSWIERVDRTRANTERATAEAEMRVRKQILKALHDEGATILMGTDAPQVFSVPGFSLHREMQVMVDAGMTPYEVLRTGTVAIAEHFGTQADAGTVAPGKQADLLLLDANPIDDIANAGRIAGVMLRGRWLSRTELDQRLAAIAAKHGN
jgi:imidazolonepropionase-like amidohydrolase